ncbi:MAG: hypothetical protein KF841_12955 [Phycisphaerae bacterium]|nr:hypothetical protein [Phycisphaerae bacterium]
MVRIVLTIIGTVLAVAGTAFAQAVTEGANIAPDNIEPLPYARPLIEYACAILFLLLAMGIGFMPSRRVKDA